MILNNDNDNDNDKWSMDSCSFLLHLILENSSGRGVLTSNRNIMN